MGSSDSKMSGQPSGQHFSGRVVIVTGAWRGLGRAAAERFHERGAAVAVIVRDRARAERLAASIGERTASEAAGYITGASFDINGGDLMM
jgi:NAD(P)-dependent dehydrogenase (short-subunit alcohol dehydrogenase family)